MRYLFRVLPFIALGFAAAMPVGAEEFYCEIMALEGAVTVTSGMEPARAAAEGDLLAVDDVVEAGEGAFADLAYDRDWQNVTRLEANSKLRIRTLYPTSVALESGGIFAKLKQLPRESTFEVQTPTAIASVRGTEYRTTFIGGETEIYNVSDSDVFVYGVQESGERQPEPVIIRNAQKVQVQRRGFVPSQPRRMEEVDFHPVHHARERIDEKVQRNMAQGRMGKIQEVRQVESGEWRQRPRDERLAEMRRAGQDGMARNMARRPGEEAQERQMEQRAIREDQRQQFGRPTFGQPHERPQGPGERREGAKEDRPERPKRPAKPARPPQQR
jgi:hypothetical protein